MEAVELVRAVINEAWRFYQYLSKRDSKVCPQCSQYDYSVMTRREIEGTFPYLDKVSDRLWLPNVHPNCRCELRFEEEEEEDLVKQDNRWKKK